jgi:hypothetical protein
MLYLKHSASSSLLFLLSYSLYPKSDGSNNDPTPTDGRDIREVFHLENSIHEPIYKCVLYKAQILYNDHGIWFSPTASCIISLVIPL